jgi:hypothetical protein
MINHRITRTAAVALAIAGASAPAASAMPIDGPVGRSAELRQDLRQPDTRDAAEGRRVYTPAPAETPPQDLRNPDTRDYAEGRGTYNSPEVIIVDAPAPAAQPTAGGIDWEDVGIGAGGLLGVALIGAGGALAVLHRRTARQLAS